MAPFLQSGGLRACVLGMLVLLSACVGGERKSRPGPPTQPKPSAADVRACYANLDAAAIRYERVPDRSQRDGCGYSSALRLTDFGVPSSNLGVMTCPLAARFTAWVRYGVAPAAQIALGSPVVRVETMGSYACRSMRGNGSTQLSQHAFANAVDIGAFVLADGRRISVKTHWKNGGPEGRFLALIHQSACKRFRTVLSPDFNAAHADHLHFDLGGRGTYCR